MNAILPGELGASSSINNYKIVIIGDIGVGKTSILSRFRYGSFEPEYMPTLGIDFFTKNLFFEDKTIRLILWDTAGQERFRSLIPSYLKNADCIIIVFDLTNKESFTSLNKWLSDAKNNASEGTIYVLCGNKSDLKEKRMVSDKEINEYVKNNELIYNECSAKNGEGVKELFNVVAKNLGEANFVKSESINIDFNNVNNNENNDKRSEQSKSNYIINKNFTDNESQVKAKMDENINNTKLNNANIKKRNKIPCC
jgi:Ras-related protein Rab-6A